MSGRVWGWGLLAVAAWSGGCVSFNPAELAADSLAHQVDARSNPAGIVFYVDGAGGGGPLSDATPDIRRGLALAGFRGDFHGFRWQSGLGALADELMSVADKRRKADDLARRIRAALAEQPDGPITLIASSAGAAVAVFALEALRDARVDAVVLMSSAMSSDYDLTTALAAVAGRVYVLTSDRDALLKSIVPLVGTACRSDSDAAPAGVAGFVLPPGANENTRAAYAKIVTMPWSAEYEPHGHLGGHTDCKSPRFVQHVIAPLLPAADLAFAVGD